MKINGWQTIFSSRYGNWYFKNNGVEYVFGIPGAKIDYLFDALEDDGPELIVTRHEQNAAMMAQGIGRLTGKPG